MNQQESFPRVDGTCSGKCFCVMYREFTDSVLLDPCLSEENLKTVSAFFSLVQIFVCTENSRTICFAGR